MNTIKEVKAALSRSSPDFDVKEFIELCEGCFEGLTNLNVDNRADFEKQLYQRVYDCVDLMLLVNHPEKMKKVTEEVITDLWEHRNKFLQKEPARFAYCVVAEKTIPFLESNSRKFAFISNYATKILEICKTF